ncbi:MAG: MlaD family protein, partial [Gemmatimonadales bacterium]
TMWLKGETIGPERLYRIEFDNVGGLKAGADVTISGVSKGKVKNIELEDGNRVLVSISLSPSITPKTDASAAIESGFFSADSKLLFNPGVSGQPLPDKTIIQGSLNKGLTGQATSLGDRADSVLLGVQAIANQRTADDLHGTLVAMQKLMNILSAKLPESSDEARQTLQSLRRLSDRMEATLASPAFTSTLNHLDTATANLSALSAQFTTTGARLDTLLSNINRGQGTIGKFATDSGLYTDARAASQSLKALLDELEKHPGKITVQVKIF